MAGGHRLISTTMELSSNHPLAIRLVAILSGFINLALLGQVPPNYQLSGDWLINANDYVTRIERDTDLRRITLSNGLISRTWQLHDCAISTSLRNHMNGQELLRALSAEISFSIDGTPYQIGGPFDQPNLAYLSPRWLETLSPAPGQWRLTAIDFDQPKERFPWKRLRHHAPNVAWPPNGRSLHFHYEPNGETTPKVNISVHYEMYDGIPAISKWFTLENHGRNPVNLDSFKAEILRLVPYEDPVELREGVPIDPPHFHVETDFAFGGFSVKNSRRHSVHWLPDTQWQTQVNWAKQNPSLLEAKPSLGPDQTLRPGQHFESFRVFELVFDSTDRERQGLAQRRLYRTVAPWVTENPVTLHVVSTEEVVVKSAIDQAASCGFEMVSLSFGSGLNMEDESVANLEKFRALTDYAATKSIHLGGYSLLSSRRIKPDSDNIINPETGKPGGQTHGYCPALASPWGQNYFRRLTNFFEETGFLQFTHDGSYPGDFDAAARPPQQKGLLDSQWVQWRIITQFYQWLRAQGAYLRVPDYYFLAGANEAGMGYREVNWSLPRVQQQIHTRQNIYDGAWQKTPSMGWMFVPLTQYHGGGAAATIEPLHQNLPHYSTMLASNLGAGVQAVYRGHRLYDTPETKALVTQWVDWFMTHRDILESDIIHSSSRRAHAQGLDWFFHANPQLKTKGFLVVYNPLDTPQSETIPVNLYYTGIEEHAIVAINGTAPTTKALDERHRVSLSLTVPARGEAWIAFSQADLDRQDKR